MQSAEVNHMHLHGLVAVRSPRFSGKNEETRMRLLTFTFRGTTRLGAMSSEGDVIDLNRAEAMLLKTAGEARATELSEMRLPSDMVAFLRGGDPAIAAAQA